MNKQRTKRQRNSLKPLSQIGTLQLKNGSCGVQANSNNTYCGWLLLTGLAVADGSSCA